ncbi:MAG: glycoside hydrolase family 3 C-terminal domain-containing protein [candidate division KSB1 bacterium]|nr:glycoside hydrolase family 3 C-terminal domain-containing protein [candidate division KSB1 bacterium]MDZ7346340.1 glycoside hydrolase family 3 C-terminal domain-containing protein [candidate division KSB1 bacterium]
MTQKYPYQNPELPIDQRLEDLMARMTLQEKVAQVLSIWLLKAQFISDGAFDEEKAKPLLANGMGIVCRPSETRLGPNLGPRKNAEFANAIQRFAVEKTRLGIPILFHEEALHGQQAPGATNFPQAIALASTWDVDLVRQVYETIAAEIRVRGAQHVLTPVLDVARDPRWGRVEETFGEDPYLVAEIGAAAIRGFQGEKGRIDERHVAATAKHFAAHGQPENGTNCGPASFPERMMREVFLYPFEIAVKREGVKAIMAAYHEIDGVPCHQNHWLLQRILREEWGFRGIVVSDYYAVEQLEELHHVAADKAECAVKALTAGVDSELPDMNCYPLLQELIASGKLDEAVLDKAVERILRLKFELGLFEHPYTDPDLAERITRCEAHRQLARRAGEKAAILLKNANGLLPLDMQKIKRLAVVGPNAADIHLGGYTDEPRVGVPILDGLQEKLKGKVEVVYAEGCRITEGYASWFADEVIPASPELNRQLIAEAVRVAAEADVIVACIGDNEQTCREAWKADHLGDRPDLKLVGQQNDLIHALAATGKPIVVVLNHGRPIDLTPILDEVAAILDIWYLGEETGHVVADILFGDVNPGGKLPITYPRSVGHLPAYYYKKPSANRGYLFDQNTPLFPFGFGLSYTTFRYEDLRLDPTVGGVGTKVKVSVRVTNTGSRAGDEVVQLYIHDKVASVTRPIKELRDFQRITLKPGESRTVEFVLTPEKLAFYNEAMQRVVEPGEFEIMVGGNSEELLSAVYTVQ